MARRTVLVCDDCGTEVGENKGATMRVTFTDARRGSKVADLCDDCAGKVPGRTAARRGRRPKAAAEPPRLERGIRPDGRERSVLGQDYHGSVGLSLLAGPANAGKVALLLERYLARLDDEPFLIVPNRSDVDRVERDLLARCGCLLGGSIGTFDDLFERIVSPTPSGARSSRRRSACSSPAARSTR